MYLFLSLFIVFLLFIAGVLFARFRLIINSKKDLIQLDIRPFVQLIVLADENPILQIKVLFIKFKINLFERLLKERKKRKEKAGFNFNSTGSPSALLKCFVIKRCYIGLPFDQYYGVAYTSPLWLVLNHYPASNISVYADNIDQPTVDFHLEARVIKIINSFFIK